MSTGKVNEADYKSILVKAGVITQEEADTLVTKANTLAKKENLKVTNLLKVALGQFSAFAKANPWLVAISATVLAIAGITKVVDALTTSTEEHKEKLETLKGEYSSIVSELESVNSELETTRERLAELDAKDSLTFTEKEEYDNLVKQNNELQRTLDLLEQEEKQKNKEINKEFVATMTSDTNDNWEYASDSNGNIIKGNAGLWSLSGSTYVGTNETAYIEQQFEEREKLLDELNNASTTAEKKRIQEQIDEIDEYLSSKNTEWSSIASEISYIDEPTTEDEEAVNEWLDFIYDFQDKMAIAQGGTNAKENTFNRIVDNWQFDDVVQDLQDLGEQGKVTAEMLDDPVYDEFIDKLVELGVIDSKDNLEDIALAFNKIALAAEASLDTTLSFTNALSQIQSLSDGLDQLDKIYSDVYDKEEFDWSSILNNEEFAETFSGFEEEYTNFIQTISNSPDDIDACQSAFDDLATAYIYSTDALKNVTVETKASTIAMLEQMGIANAEEVVLSQLAINTANLSDAQKNLNEIKEKGIDASIDLEDATAVEIFTLIEEAKQAGYNTDALYNYVMQKIQANDITIFTNGDIENLSALCKSLNVANESLIKYNTLKSKLSNLSSTMYTDDDTYSTGFGGIKQSNSAQEYYKTLKEIDSLQSDIEQELIDYYTTNLKGNFTGGTSTNSVKKSSSSSSTKETSKTFDHIETALSNMEDALSDLDSKVSNTYSTWTERNNKLVESISKTKEAIDLQNKAYNAYMSMANSVGLSDFYKNLVQNGAMNISVITDETLADQISTYQDYYEKAQACLDTANELQNTLNEISSSEKWDLIKTETNADKSIYDSQIDVINTFIDKLEMMGKYANESSYDGLIFATQNKITVLKNQADQLSNILGTMSKDTEAYDTMFEELLSIRQEISELENDCIEFNNNIRDLNWEVFEYLEDSISRINDEMDYLVGLLANEDLFDEKGKRTKYADATIALHAASYDVYKQMAQDYKEEMLDLQEQLTNGNMDVLEQYRNIEDAHRDAVNSMNDEKQAILDLIQNGYENQFDVLQKVVDKRQELLDVEKSAYEYQKSIEEQTKNVSDIKKQMIANDGDTSESGKALAQQLKVQLEEAERALEETEYEKYLSDQRELLDSLTLEYEEWMNQRMDDENALLEQIIGEIATEGDEINTTLNEVAEKNGTLISNSITSIFDAQSPFTNALTSISNGVAGTTTAINNLIAQVQNIAGILGSTNAGTSSGGSGSSSSSSSSSSVGGGSNHSSTSTSSSATTQSASSSSGNDNIFIYKKDGYPKSKLNKENSIVDRLKFHDFDSSFSARATYYSKLGGTDTYRGSASQNRWLIDKMKERGYKKGSSNIPFDQMNWIHDGEIVLKRVSDDGLLMGLSQGSKVFTEEQSNALWNLSKMNLDAIKPNINLPTMPVVQSRQAPSQTIGDVSVNIELPNVQSYEDFMTKAQHDSRFEGMIQQIAFGKNSTGKYKYKWN